METIVNSFNIFVDTSRGTETGNEAEGDCFLLDLNDTNINTKTGQDIRLTLTNFSMYYVTTNINANNSRFQLRTNLTANVVNRKDHSLDLSHKNYALIRDIGLDFANALKVALLNDLSAGLVKNIDISGLTPETTAGIAGTSNNIISFDLVTKNTGGTLQAHGLQSLVIQFHEKDPTDGTDSDVFDILGGDRISDQTDLTTQSIDVNIQSNYIRISSKYPCQRFSESHIYLSTNIPSKNLASSSITAGTSDKNIQKVHPTTILAKIPIDTEAIFWSPTIEKQFFIDVHINHLTNIKLRLEDHHGRRLPQFGPNQNTKGNMSFTCVIRVDVIQKFKPEHQIFKDKNKRGSSSGNSGSVDGKDIMDNSVLGNNPLFNRYY